MGVGLLCSAPFAALALSASSLIILKLSVAGFGLFGGRMMGTIFPAAYDVVDHRNYGFGSLHPESVLAASREAQRSFSPDCGRAPLVSAL